MIKNYSAKIYKKPFQKGFWNMTFVLFSESLNYGIKKKIDLQKNKWQTRFFNQHKK